MWPIVVNHGHPLVVKSELSPFLDHLIQLFWPWIPIFPSNSTIFWWNLPILDRKHQFSIRKWSIFDRKWLILDQSIHFLNLNPHFSSKLAIFRWNVSILDRKHQFSIRNWSIFHRKWLKWLKWLIQYNFFGPKSPFFHLTWPFSDEMCQFLIEILNFQIQTGPFFVENDLF